MKSLTLSSSLALFGLLFAFTGGYLLGQSPNPPVIIFDPGANMPADARDTFPPFWNAWNLIHSRYLVQPLDDPHLTEGAIEGMVDSLDDPYTHYLTPEDEALERELLAGQVQGIGASVELVDNEITIVSPFPGSPAEAAGLMPGDILRAAAGVDLSDLDVNEAGYLIRGPAGSTVDLVIERDGVLLQITVVRGLTEVVSVAGFLLDENIAYLRLNRFGETTAAELTELLSTLLQAEPFGLIVDVRRNPGGAVETAVDVANQFLPEGIVLIEQFGDGREVVLVSDNNGEAMDLPIAVLVDEGSASAAEVLAGAIQARNRGVLIGQRTFGKGTIQNWHALSNGGGLRFTTARWLTPTRDWVTGQGLTPDYFVSMPGGSILGGKDDAQLAAAVNYLLGSPLESEPEQSGG